MTAPKPINYNVRPPDSARTLPANYRHGDARLIHDADQAADDLTRIVTMLPGILERIRDAQAGQVRSSLGSGGGSGGGSISRPTELAAIGADGARSDEAALIAHLRVAAGSVRATMDLAVRYTPRAATGRHRDEAEADNRRWCESCSRIDAHDGLPWREWPHTQARTTVGGRLAVPMLLCRWCYDMVIRTEAEASGPRLPTEDELGAHHGRGKDAKRRVVGRLRDEQQAS